jgi:hypothetical protein
MGCADQERLSQELNSAIKEHNAALDEMVKLVRSGQSREGLSELIMRAASAKTRAASLREKLDRHLMGAGLLSTRPD